MSSPSAQTQGGVSAQEGGRDKKTLDTNANCTLVSVDDAAGAATGALNLANQAYNNDCKHAMNDSSNGALIKLTVPKTVVVQPMAPG